MYFYHPLCGNDPSQYLLAKNVIYVPRLVLEFECLVGDQLGRSHRYTMYNFIFSNGTLYFWLQIIICSNVILKNSIVGKDVMVRNGAKTICTGGVTIYSSNIICNGKQSPPVYDICEPAGTKSFMQSGDEICIWNRRDTLYIDASQNNTGREYLLFLRRPHWMFTDQIRWTIQCKEDMIRLINVREAKVVCQGWWLQVKIGSLSTTLRESQFGLIIIETKKYNK